MTKGDRILVVDDDPNLCELVQVNLENRGFCVDTALSGQQAWEKLQHGLYRVVILDVMMPDLDGWELCKLIRDNPDMADIRILFLTARNQERDRMIGREILLADAYLTKPFDLEKLLTVTVRLAGEAQ